MRFILTGGQQHDITQAEELNGEHVLAEGPMPLPAHPGTGYDAVHSAPLVQGTRRDRHLCHLVECFINKIKHYRRIFSRFEKLDTRYLGFLHFTAALIWLR